MTGDKPMFPPSHKYICYKILDVLQKQVGLVVHIITSNLDGAVKLWTLADHNAQYNFGKDFGKFQHKRILYQFDNYRIKGSTRRVDQIMSLFVHKY